ncbi:MAG TPA: MFS transporter [Ktedonobacteraceae bacterium]|nr:MFS transporter [Ktedonobacteraceae bacterium]
MATPPREQNRQHEKGRNRPHKSHRWMNGRLPYRPVGAPIRYTSPLPPLEPPPTPRVKTVQRRLEGLFLAAFINRNFALMWWGQAISSIGDYAWDTALVLWIASYLAAGQSWAPLAVSGVVLAAALPQIVVGPIAGVFVDRWDKRRTMIIMAMLQAIVATMLVLAALNIRFPFVGSEQFQNFWRIVAVYIDVVALTIFAQFFIPAQFALIKDIVPEQKQDQALETSQAIQGLSIIIGPPVAAALVFGLGVAWALVLDACSFMIVLFAIFAIQAPPSAHSLAPGEAGHFSREFLDGLGYVINHRVLRTILVAEVLTWLGFGALQSLGYFFITENLHAPASDYGLFGADFGVGAIVGALLVTLIGQRIGLSRLLWVSLITSGLFVILMSHVSNFPIALGAAFLFGVSTTAIIVTAGPLALHGTSREYVGRVMAVINPIGRLAALVSVVLAGYFVSTVLQGFHASLLGITFGPIDTVFTFMGLLAMAGGFYARVSLRAIAESVPAPAEPGQNNVQGHMNQSQHAS